jgi:glutathione S-transferase
MLKLYFAPGACSFVPHVALEMIKAATGTDFEPALVKLHKGEQTTPEYLAMNPNGQVPILLVDGKPLTQIVAICEYLDRNFPQAGLLPTDPWARSQALSMLAWMNNSVHPTFTHIFRPEKFAAGDDATAELKRFNTVQFAQLLERIQGHIAQAHPYLFGDKLSFADIYTIVFWRWGGIAGIDPDTLPVYKAYVDRLAALPMVAAAIERERIVLHAFKKA